MATIKSHTDLSQSKKLAEILNHESADMYWFEGEPFVEAVTGYNEERAESHRQAGMEMYPCWSLTALLEVLPILERKGYQKAKPRLSYNVIINKWIVDSHVYTTDAYDNPVDACYEMILKLNEEKIL